MEEYNTIKLPYDEFMGLTNLSKICPILGQQNIRQFVIKGADCARVSLIYKPSDVAGCTRSIVFFSQAKKPIDADSFYSCVGWRVSDAHVFYVSDPFYFQNFIGGNKCKAPCG